MVTPRSPDSNCPLASAAFDHGGDSDGPHIDAFILDLSMKRIEIVSCRSHGRANTAHERRPESKGLGGPLDEIVKRARVSPGTLYNRFANREAIIDAVLPELAKRRFEALVEMSERQSSSWSRLATYVEQTCLQQEQDPLLNDVVSRRHPESRELRAVCDRALSYGESLLREAQKEGQSIVEFGREDLFFLFWSHGLSVRNEEGNAATRRRFFSRALSTLRRTDEGG